MSKASSVVAFVLQQSRQRVPQYWTEYRLRLLKGHISSDGTTAVSLNFGIISRDFADLGGNNS